MNKKLVLGLTSITIFTSVALLGCSVKKNAATTKDVQSQAPKKSEASNIKDTTINNSEASKVIAQEVPADVPLSRLKYNITSIPYDTKMEFNTPWKASPSGNFKATIEGKGETAEEGYSHIIIKNEKSGKVQKLALENEGKNQVTAKYLEWIDESNMLVILGNPFGTVTKGGKIYKVNIESGEASLYVNTSSSKEEYTAVHKSQDGFNFDKYVYDDDNFTKGHTVSGILELK